MPSREHVARVLPGADALAESRRIELRQAADLEGVVAIPGARELLAAWPPDRKWPRPGRLRLTIGKPLRFDELPPNAAGRAALTAAARDAVAALRA